MTWQPGVNFTGVVAASSLLGALLGYVATSAVLPLRGLAETLPEARQLVKAVPGSLGALTESLVFGGFFGGETPGILIFLMELLGGRIMNHGMLRKIRLEDHAIVDLRQ